MSEWSAPQHVMLVSLVISWFMLPGLFENILLLRSCWHDWRRLWYSAILSNASIEVKPATTLDATKRSSLA
jgi:hypothetical protein